MKKAVITTGGKQYLVSEGEILDVDFIKTPSKDTSLEALLVINEDNITVGKPTVEGVKVKVEIIEQETKGDKVLAIRYKAKKRVRKVHGHRQTLTKIKIARIS